ncbi:MAG: hypothetical protein KKB21_01355, partial [Nanoarchaeota archaeon]|nr:hypothetical protein [Nanoarchaeota archaeon]
RREFIEGNNPRILDIRYNEQEKPYETIIVLRDNSFVAGVDTGEGITFEQSDGRWLSNEVYNDGNGNFRFGFDEGGKPYKYYEESEFFEGVEIEYITDENLVEAVKSTVISMNNANLPTTTPTTTPAIDLSIPFYKRNIYTEAEAQGIAILTKKLTWGMLNLLLENFAYKFIDKMCIKDKGKSSHSGGRASNTSLITNSTNSTTNNQTIV